MFAWHLDTRLVSVYLYKCRIREHRPIVFQPHVDIEHNPLSKIRMHDVPVSAVLRYEAFLNFFQRSSFGLRNENTN